MMAFSAKEVMPGVFHIQDCMGVCMTLLTGSERALLIDTGYGLENVAAFVRTLTELPLTVVLTHGHHDHMLGACWFPKTLMFAQDQEDFVRYSSCEQRERVLASARQKGIVVDEAAYLKRDIPMPEALQEETIDLGGLTVKVMLCPGHTPGSAVAYVPEHRLLLSGDDWNPCTWLFFPAALGMREYRANLLALMQLPFEYVLCSHQPVLFPRERMAGFAGHLTDENLRAAPAVDIPPYEAIDTHQADMGDGQIFVFDWQKAGME